MASFFYGLDYIEVLQFALDVRRLRKSHPNQWMDPGHRRTCRPQTKVCKSLEVLPLPIFFRRACQRLDRSSHFPSFDELAERNSTTYCVHRFLLLCVEEKTYVSNRQ